MRKNYYVQQTPKIHTFNHQVKIVAFFAEIHSKKYTLFYSKYAHIHVYVHIYTHTILLYSLYFISLYVAEKSPTK